MHHLKETTIDGVKFVLIPEELHDELIVFVLDKAGELDWEGDRLAKKWLEYDPEVFNVQ